MSRCRAPTSCDSTDGDDAQAGAYRRIFERLGLRYYEVESDVGMMGGSAAMEYMAPSPAGEDRIALAEEHVADAPRAEADLRYRQAGSAERPVLHRAQ